MTKKISITLWGPPKDGAWDDWYKDMIFLFNEIGCNITHFGVSGTSLNPHKIYTLKRMEKKINKILSDGVIPSSMSFYCLNSDYKIAAFDYEILTVRNHEYISFILNDKYYSTIKEEMITCILNKYINYIDGEIFSTSYNEVPLIYSSLKNANGLNSYNCIKKL